MLRDSISHFSVGRWVRRSVRRSVGRSVGRSVTPVQKPRFSAVFGHDQILDWIYCETNMIWEPPSLLLSFHLSVCPSVNPYVSHDQYTQRHSLDASLPVRACFSLIWYCFIVVLRDSTRTWLSNNLLYNNVEAQNVKKIRTLVTTSSASENQKYNNISASSPTNNNFSLRFAIISVAFNCNMRRFHGRVAFSTVF